MLSYKTHLSELQEVASRCPTAPAFKVPAVIRDGVVEQWRIITYQRFLLDVEIASKYWFTVLTRDNVPQRAVIGMWLAGFEYSDVVHIYGLSRAGYIPQLISLRLPNPTVVFELLGKSSAKALIFDRSFKDVIHKSPVPLHVACFLKETECCRMEPLPRFHQPRSGDELVFIYHTSGSTSGSPKLVPCNYVYIDSTMRKSWQVCRPMSTAHQSVSTWMGSMCHIAQSFMLMGSIQHAACTIQPSRIDFSSSELADMIKQCGLNQLRQFPTFLAMHLRNARNDPKFLALLRSMHQVTYSGLPLPKEDEEFAFRSGIRLVNLFGSTEGGALLVSSGESAPVGRLLHPLSDVDYEFVPLKGPSKTESGHVATNSQLKELVILSSSPDCPHHSLRSSSDGHFHTGDLFQEMLPGQYLFRGRDDDWIKTRTSLRCDTRSIEDNVRLTCGDLLDNCIVVGSGRPSPALFVEASGIMSPDTLKAEIIRRTRQFHARRYVHERITNVDLIFVVSKNTLPRTATKGNIRRQAVEEMYKRQLDQAYGIEGL